MGLLAELASREISSAAHLILDSTLLASAVHMLLLQPSMVNGAMFAVEGWRRTGLLDGPASVIAAALEKVFHCY